MPRLKPLPLLIVVLIAIAAYQYFGPSSLQVIIPLFSVFLLLLYYFLRKATQEALVIVEVDNHALLFPIAQVDMPIGTLFTNAVPGVIGKRGVWIVDYDAIRTNAGKPEPTVNVEGGTYPAVLKTCGKTFHFFMKKERTRCECDDPTPHWTGDRYTGTHVELVGNIY